MTAKPRSQGYVNRALGLNAGRERRIAAGNREEASHERRAEVFRQDVPHSGNAGDVIKAMQVDYTAALAVCILALHEEKPKLAQLAIAVELDTTQATVSRILSEFRNGKRDPMTGYLIKRTCGCRGKQHCAACG